VISTVRISFILLMLILSACGNKVPLTLPDNSEEIFFSHARS